MAGSTRTLKLLLELSAKGSYKPQAGELASVSKAAREAQAALGGIGKAADFKGMQQTVKAAVGDVMALRREQDAAADTAVRVAKASGDYSRALALVKTELGLADANGRRYNSLLVEQAQLQAKLTTETQKAAQAQQRASQQATAAANQRRSGRSEWQDMQQTKQASDSLLGSVKQLAAGYIGLQGAQMALDWAKQGAAIQGVDVSFKNLAESSGRSSKAMLSELKAASQGMISDAKLMEGANKAMLLGGERLATALPKLLQIAQASAKATGQDVQFVFDSLVTGLARSSKQIIDNAGITVDVGAANEAYAASIGKTVLALSDQEKAIAFQNAVMLQGEDFLIRLGTATDGAAAKMAQASASWANFTNSLKTGLATVFVWGIEQVSLAGQGLAGFGTRVDELTVKALTGKTSFDGYLMSLTAVGEQANAMAPPVYAAAEALVATGVAAPTAAAMLQPLGDIAEQVGGGFMKQADAAYATTEAQNALAQKAVDLAAHMGDGGVAVAELTEMFGLQQMTGAELDAALNELSATTLYNQQATWANAEAQAYGTEQSAILAAAVWQLSDAGLANAETNIQQQIEAERLANFQYDLEQAVAASNNGMVGGIAAAMNLSLAYGIQLPKVNALIAAHNELHNAIAGRKGAQVGAAVAGSASRQVSMIDAGYGYLLDADYGKKTGGGRKAGGGGNSKAKGAGKSTKELDPAKEAAEAAKQAGATAESLAKLRGFVAPSKVDVDAYTASLAMVVASYGERSKEIAKHLNEDTAKFTDMSGKAISSLKSGVEGFNAVRGYVAVPRENLTAFTGDMAELVRQFGERSKEVNLDLASNTMLFSETAAKAVGTIGEGVEGFKALAGFKGVAQVEIALFSLGLRDVFREWGQRVKEIDLSLAEGANTFSDAASKAIGTVAAGIDAFIKLEKYRGVPQEKISLIGQDIRLTVQLMTTMAAEFNAEGVAAAAVFADSVGRIIAPISTAVDAFMKLEEYKGVTPAIMQMVYADMRQAVVLMQQTSALMDAEGVAAAAVFAGHASTMFTAISGGTDAMGAIREYESVAPAAFGAFANDFMKAVEMTSQLAGASGVMLSQSDIWRSNIDAAVGNIKAGIDSIASLNGLSVNVSASVSASGSGGSAPAGGGVPAAGGFTAPGFWAGGHTEAYAPITVGERGREVFVPDRPGRIAPNHEVAGPENSSAGSIIVNAVPGMVQVIVQGGDPTAVKRAVGAAMSEWEQKQKAEARAEARGYR